MLSVLFFGGLLLAPIAAIALARTRAWWLLGVATIACAGFFVPTCSDDGGALPVVDMTPVYFTVCLVYGAALLVLALWGRKRWTRTADPAALDPARRPKPFRMPTPPPTGAPPI